MLLVGCLCLALAGCAKNNSNIEQGTINLDNLDVIDVQSVLNESADEARFSVFMNSNIVMKTSKDDANILIQNPEENKLDCKAYIYLNETEECIYESDNIPAGFKVEYAPISKQLDTGVYDCTGEIHLLNSDGTSKSMISMSVTITIIE